MLRRLRWLSTSAFVLSLAYCAAPDCERSSLPAQSVDSLLATKPWLMRAERFRPGSGGTLLLCADDGVPARFTSMVPSKDRAHDRITFLLTDSATGRATTGTWQGSYTATGGPYGSLLLGFAVPQPGTYTGKLTIGAQSVVVALRVTHWVIWPSLAILLGVLLSYWMQRYRAFSRTLLLLRMRAERISDLLAQANGAFRAAAARSGTPIALPSLRSDVERQIVGVVRDIDDVRIVGASLDSANTVYVRVCATLDALESSIATFPLLATDLVAVGNAVAAARALVQQTGRPPTSTTPNGSEPPLIVAAAANLAARDMATADLTSYRTSAQGAAALLGRWNAAMKRLVAINQDLDKAKLEKPAKAADIDRLRATRVEQIWRELYDAPDSNALDTALGYQPFETIAGDLAQIIGSPGRAAQVIATAASLPRTPVPTLRRASFWSALAASYTAFRAALTPHSLTDAEQSGRAATTILFKVRALDLAFFLLALAAAVVTGLNQFYYGKAFGTPEDYLLAFVWGFGTKTLLDAVLSGINRLTGTPPTSAPPVGVTSGAPPAQAL